MIGALALRPETISHPFPKRRRVHIHKAKAAKHSSAVRLVGALLIEENDRWATISKANYSTGVAELEGRMAELAGIARERERRMSAG